LIIMASLATACRMSAKLVGGQLRNPAVSRGFRTSAAVLAAQNFAMPALSPTMTEGNIASWKVKEGDSFSTGDLLLEIETDKAQMDVEAQDDGVMAKIILGDGSKGVKVGSRIAVIAEPGDDLSTLALPAEEPAAAAPTPQEETSGGVDKSKSSESQAEAPPASKATSDTSAAGAPSSTGKIGKQKYPLYPSVEHLLHEKGLPESEAEKIPATGPNGRLLKGDVLAYLGRIEASYSSDLSAKILEREHLDLSHIKLAAPPPKEEPSPTAAAAAAAAAAAPPVPAPEPVTEVTLPVSLAAVYQVQKRIQDTLGVLLPVSTFIARATEVANDNLPRSKTAKPSADELFNQVLGLDKISSSSSRGSFTPQISALPRQSSRAKSSRAQSDIFDSLLSKSSRRSASGKLSSPLSAVLDQTPTTNVFSVRTEKGDQRRAKVFLERVKALLEAEPGRLVL